MEEPFRSMTENLKGLDSLLFKIFFSSCLFFSAARHGGTFQLHDGEPEVPLTVYLFLSTGAVARHVILWSLNCWPFGQNPDRR